MTVNAALDALGDRLASGTSGGYAWLIPDLHGNVVGQLNSSGSTVTDAFRYDAYGLTEGTVLSGSIPSPWRFQGKLLESTSGGRDLYDFVARSYSPDIGAFTQLDSVAGSATNPVTLDRYLYAAGNPETLIDPDGHCTSAGGDVYSGQHGNGACPNTSRYAGGGAAASVAKAAKAAAATRATHGSAAYDCQRYGECGGQTATIQAAPTRDQGWETLSAADQQHIDNPILTGMMQARKDADLSGSTGFLPRYCGRGGCPRGGGDGTPLLVIGGVIVLGACVLFCVEAIAGAAGVALAGAATAGIASIGSTALLNTASGKPPLEGLDPLRLGASMALGAATGGVSSALTLAGRLTVGGVTTAIANGLADVYELFGRPPMPALPSDPVSQFGTSTLGGALGNAIPWDRIPVPAVVRSVAEPAFDIFSDLFAGSL